MIITESMRAAGIIAVGTQNTNGSYTCTVDLNRVDLKCMKSNPRKYSKKHGQKIGGSRWNRLCIRNPVLRYQDDIVKLSSIDGRHTAHQLKEKGMAIVTADVFFNITDQEAALIFHELTVNSKEIKGWDAHEAALMAGLSHAVEIQGWLDLFEMTGGTGKADFRCYGVAMEAYLTGNNTIERFFYVLKFCFSKTTGDRVEQDAKGCEFLRGLLDLVAHLSDEGRSVDDIVPLLKQYRAAELKAKAEEIARTKGVRSPSRKMFLAVFLEMVDSNILRMAA